MSESSQKSKQDLSKSRIAQANGRLKAGKIPVLIQQIGNKLYLQATLPPKPDSEKTSRHQQRIALGIPANPAGVSLAENEARKVGGLLAVGEFDWQPYVKNRIQQPETIGDWVDRFELEYRDRMADITWKTDYRNVFIKLPANEPISIDVLKRVLLTTKPDSKTRKRAAQSFTLLAKFAGLEGDFKSLQGNYSASEVEPRDLPSDEEIAQTYHSIINPGWKWVYGMIAVFGLRSHEVFYLDIEDLAQGGSMVHVLEGKTGKRMVWACYPEWIDQFALRDRILPPIICKTHEDYTQRVCNFFGRTTRNFTALDLRHCWAVRTLLCGLPYEVAAKQMGHSVSVHERTYHRWITQDVHQRIYDAVMQRPDRPSPPKMRVDVNEPAE